ncbi:MAG TPA: carboxypeptidase M32 [Phycisphaerae bacterium]|nr:carboxypeptidase M32 [Phycisphaerae bacterium]
MSDTYDKFINLVCEIGQLDSIAQLLDWDSETYMPGNGLHVRADQLALTAAMAHERRSSSRLGDLLSQLEQSNLDPVQAANVREIRRLHDRAVKVPAELVRRIAHAMTLAKDAWGKAREASSFPTFAPHLEELLTLKRQVADLIGYRTERYDALMDDFEPGITTAEVAAIFASLRGPLAAFVRQLTESKRQPDTSILHRHFPREAQERFSRRMAEAIGFNFNAGRIDVSKHPFCTGMGPGDVRLTTRYYEDFFNASVFGVLHEAGHGLYEQGLDPKHVFTPAGQSVSLGVHESQSRMWENLVGRSRPFWEAFYPECQKAFPQALGSVSLDAFYGAINRVGPSLIRVEADEVTYNLHIIVRFELERAMIDGKLAVKEVPEAWNAKMRELLGVTPPNDREGCLQDIHWSMGTFGYFPTYALGNLYAAQFFEAAHRAIPDLTDRIRRGELSPLREWLRTNIHVLGSRYRAGDLVQRVTGNPLSTEPFMRYIHGKFAPIYGL